MSSFGKGIALAVMFLLVAGASFIWQLPNSLWLQSSWTASMLPKNLRISEVSGQIADGALRLQATSVQPGPSPELGEISWLWRRGDLLAGVADARIVWRLQDSRLTAETSHTLTASELRIHSARGRLSMPSLLSLAAAFTPFAMEAEGIVNLDELHGAVAFAPEVWPVAMQGKGSLDGVKWMGIDLPRIDFVLKQNAKRDLQIALKGGEGGWRLTGDLILSPNGRYNLNVDVTASRAEELPQWTVMMRKKRRNQAVLKLGGSWL